MIHHGASLNSVGREFTLPIDRVRQFQHTAGLTEGFYWREIIRCSPQTRSFPEEREMDILYWLSKRL